MKINKSFLALIISVLVASTSYAVMYEGGADKYDTLGAMPLFIQISIFIWWFALVNVVAWLTLVCLNIGRYIADKLRS